MHQFSYQILRQTILLALAPALILSGCSKQESSGTGSGQGAKPKTKIQNHFGALTHDLQILDESGAVVANAQVLVGQEKDIPFVGNFMATDAQGVVHVSGADWISEQPVTIDAPGFVRATYFKQAPGASVFKVKHLPTNQNIEVGGVTKGFGNLSNDGVADLAFVLPGISRSNILGVQLSSLISPQTDEMNVFGNTVNVPSNVTFPDQTESYFLPISFAKPDYRAYFSDPGSYTLVAAHAQFKFKDTVDKMRGGASFFEIINDVQFVSVGLKDVAIAGGKSKVDLAVNTVALARSVPLIAPNLPTGYSMLALAIKDQGGVLFPTDLKRLVSKQKINLATDKAAKGGGSVLSLLLNDKITDSGTGAKLEEMSAVFSAANQTTDLEFLPIVAAPELRTKTLVVTAPTASPKIKPVATIAVLSKVDLVQSKKMKLEKKIPKWELIQSEWVSGFDLPTWPVAENFGKGYRWEVLFAGDQEGINTQSLGPANLEKVSHATRSAVDL